MATSLPLLQYDPGAFRSYVSLGHSVQWLHGHPLNPTSMRLCPDAVVTSDRDTCFLCSAEADLAAAQGSRDSPEISSSHQAPSSISKVTSVGHAARQSSPGNDRADGVRRQEQRSGQESMNELSRERRRRAFIGMLK